MANFMRETSRFMNERTQRINQAYGARHFRSIIPSHHYYLQAYKYIYRNPVVAGLSGNCQDYDFSSLKFLLGGLRATFPVVGDETLFSDVEGTLSWLNRQSAERDWTAVGRAMKRKEFRLNKDSHSKKPHHLNFDLL